MKTHVDENVKKTAENMDTNLVDIPGGFTKKAATLEYFCESLF